MVERSEREGWFFRRGALPGAGCRGGTSQIGTVPSTGGQAGGGTVKQAATNDSTCVEATGGRNLQTDREARGAGEGVQFFRKQNSSRRVPGPT